MARIVTVHVRWKWVVAEVKLLREGDWWKRLLRRGAPRNDGMM
jgi:hypothetical protein